MSVTDYTEYYVALAFWKYMSPILIAMGTLGNIMSMVVLSRKSMRNMSGAVYLIVLSLADIAVLYTGLLRQWMNYYFDIDVRYLSNWGCKVHLFMVYTSLDFSVWLVVAVTVDRFILVYFPLKAKSMCNRNIEMISIVVIFCCLALFNSHYLYGLDVKEIQQANSTVISICEPINESYEHFSSYVWPWLDLCAFFAFPFAILIISNVGIIYKLLPSSRPKIASVTRSSGQRARLNSMTTMLLVIDFVFLLTNAPISILLIGLPYWAVNTTDRQDAAIELWWALVNFLMYANNGINFLLYCISGPRFRNELKALLCGRKSRNQVQPSVTVVANDTV